MTETVRIIPAYAGSTTVLMLVVSRDQDHPRIRGEHFLWWWSLSEAAGSSPHTRGAHPVGAGNFADAGIIPAYAGSTAPMSATPCLLPDHPRIRGEHEPCGHVLVRHRRIIPAYAGSTRRRRSGSRRGGDHPRIRGEHRICAAGDRCVYGSSPHTRGALPARSGDRPPSRIIPAYAGSTRPGGSWPAGRPDHPRIRGEHSRRRPWPVRAEGSSPHTRGARGLRAQGRPVPGIIPAYAGSTRHSPVRRIRSPDHPRIRGEHTGGACPGVEIAGSSPHTRGALLGLVNLGCELGIIPAYAGSTFQTRLMV